MDRQQIDWTKPQRQSPAALLVLLYKALLNVLRFIWPLLILYILRKKPGNSSSDTYELVALVISTLSLIFSVLEYFNFRFSISGDQLIIKKGIFTKRNIILPFDKIQAIHIEQDWLHSLLNVSRLSFDSAGSEKMEVKIEALDKTRSQALKEFILGHRTITDTPVTEAAPEEKRILSLSPGDLFKLSISANHLEAFLLMATFIYSTLSSVGVSDQAYTGAFKWVSDTLGVEGSRLIVMMLFIALVLAIGISVIRILLTYADFTIGSQSGGYRIRSGLINKKERFVPFKKIQFISWKANWVRQKIGLFLLKFHATGSEQMENKMKVSVPVTNSSYIPTLLEHYHPFLPADEYTGVRVHKSFIWRRWMVVGLLPGIVAGSILYFFYGAAAFFVLTWLPLVLVHYMLIQRKFRVWADDECLQIKKGALGIQYNLLKWENIQYVELQQSLFQQKKLLATVHFKTAGGQISMPFLTLDKAKQLRDYALYKMETSNW